MCKFQKENQNKVAVIRLGKIEYILGAVLSQAISNLLLLPRLGEFTESWFPQIQFALLRGAR